MASLLEICTDAINKKLKELKSPITWAELLRTLGSLENWLAQNRIVSAKTLLAFIDKKIVIVKTINPWAESAPKESARLVFGGNGFEHVRYTGVFNENITYVPVTTSEAARTIVDKSSDTIVCCGNLSNLQSWLEEQIEKIATEFLTN